MTYLMFSLALLLFKFLYSHNISILQISNILVSRITCQAIFSDLNRIYVSPLITSSKSILWNKYEITQ
jgi:hypothetical protein